MSEAAGPADILVVEDDPVNRHLLTLLLEREGYAVAVAAHGGQALAYLRVHPLPRVVLLDHQDVGRAGGLAHRTGLLLRCQRCGRWQLKHSTRTA